MNRHIIVVRDADDFRFDHYLLAPARMGLKPAAKLAGKLIAETKAANPDEFSWDELEPKLIAAGFVHPRCIEASENW